jgi:hypothetical protein
MRARSLRWLSSRCAGSNCMRFPKPSLSPLVASDMPRDQAAKKLGCWARPYHHHGGGCSYRIAEPSASLLVLESFRNLVPSGTRSSQFRIKRQARSSGRPNPSSFYLRSSSKIFPPTFACQPLRDRDLFCLHSITRIHHSYYRVINCHLESSLSLAELSEAFKLLIEISTFFLAL